MPGALSDDDPSLDAFDLAVQLVGGEIVIVGLRTSGYLKHQLEPEVWPNSYRPIRVTLDLATVRYFDFNEVLWLGPDPHSCLVWGNALGMRLTAIAYMLGYRSESRLLAGPDGTGLPSPDSLGIEIPPDLKWHQVEALLGSLR